MGLAHARNHLRQRLEDALREMGVLLFVFAPIDYILATDVSRQKGMLLILFGLGAFFLGGALIAEYRRLRAD
jgi:hypothetical protein